TTNSPPDERTAEDNRAAAGADGRVALPANPFARVPPARGVPIGSGKSFIRMPSYRRTGALYASCPLRRELHGHPVDEQADHDAENYVGHNRSSSTAPGLAPPDRALSSVRLRGSGFANQLSVSFAACRSSASFIAWISTRISRIP